MPITTGHACHLDAELIHRALHGFPLADVDTLFIENVGNLVCPAIYDLGEAADEPGRAQDVGAGAGRQNERDHCADRRQLIEQHEIVLIILAAVIAVAGRAER